MAEAEDVKRFLQIDLNTYGGFPDFVKYLLQITFLDKAFTQHKEFTHRIFPQKVRTIPSDKVKHRH